MVSVRVASSGFERTLAPAVYVDRGEVVVAEEVSGFVAIGNVTSRIGINILFRESKIDHVDGFLVWGEANDAVSELNVAMQQSTVVHELQPGDLHVIRVSCGYVRTTRRSRRTICCAKQHTLRRSMTFFPLRRKRRSKLFPRRSMANQSHRPSTPEPHSLGIPRPPWSIG